MKQAAKPCLPWSPVTSSLDGALPYLRGLRARRQQKWEFFISIPRISSILQEDETNADLLTSLTTFSTPNNSQHIFGIHVFNMRQNDSGVFKNEITRNPYVWAALAFCTALLLIAVYLPGLSDALRVQDPGLNGWAVILGMSFVPLVVGQVAKLFGKG